MRKKPVFHTRIGVDARITAPPQPRPALRQSILVVDDDPIIRRLNHEVLIHSGYQVDAAENGSVAWNALLTNNYDLMVTDNDMPKLTGVDLLKKIHAARMKVSVVMATGTSPAWEFAQFPWLRPAGMVIKPYTFKELLATVKEVLHPAATTLADIAPPNWDGMEPDGDLQP